MTQQNEFEESARDVTNHEMPDDSYTASSDSDSGDDSDTTTTCDQSPKKYFIFASDNEKNDDSNITSDSSDDSYELLKSRDTDIDWFKNYTAEKITQHKVDNSGKITYYVRWLNWSPEYDTWQSEKSFPQKFTMLDEYKSKHKLD